MHKKIIFSLLLLQGCQNMSTQEEIARAGRQGPIDKLQVDQAGNSLSSSKLPQTQWQLVTYRNAQGLKSALPDHLASMIFADGKVSGSTGCNQYFAAYQLAENKGIKFSEVGSTMMACQGEIAEQEQQFLQNLNEIRFYQIQDGQLILLDVNNQQRLVFTTLPTLTLENNDWEARGINNGRGGVVSTAYTKQAHLHFSDGKLHGSSGCNSLSANYQIDKDSLTIGPVRSTRKFCSAEGLMEQEQQMIRALEQVARYEIHINRLRLLDSNGSLMMNLELKR